MKSVKGIAVLLQIAMTLYRNKNLEEMGTNWKIIFRNKTKKNHEKAGNYNLQKPFEMY